MDNATQTGAEQTQQVNPRLQALQEIAAAGHEARASEFQSFNEESGEIAPQEQQPEPQAEQQAEQQPEPEPQTEPQAAQPNQTEDEEEIVVHGQTLKVPKAKIFEAGKRTLQKEVAADRRLQEATEMRRQAEALLARAQAAAQGAVLPHDTQPSDEDAAQASQPTLDPRAVLSAADQLIERRMYEREANNAAKQFIKDFPDIASDPLLANYAVQLENQRIMEATTLGNPLGDPYEAYRKHGEAIRNWQRTKGLLREAKPNDEKLEAKRQAVQNVPAANVRAQAPQPPKPKTVDDVIAEMRKARHQRVE